MSTNGNTQTLSAIEQRLNNAIDIHGNKVGKVNRPRKPRTKGRKTKKTTTTQKKAT